MAYKHKEHNRIYQLGFETGSRIKGGGCSFDWLIGRYDRLRREYNKRIKQAINKYKEELIRKLKDGEC